MTVHSSFDLMIAAMAASPLPTPASRLQVELCRYEDLTRDDRAEWAMLSGRAGQDNVFAQDWFMDAALRHRGEAPDIRLAIVRDHDGSLIGVLPLCQTPRLARWPIANWQTWKATNQFLGSPLVARGAERAFWDALLAHLDVHPGKAFALHCLQFAEAGRVATALVEHCAERGRSLHVTDRFERPARRPWTSAIAAGASGRKLRSRLAALERRFTRDHGPVVATLHAPDEPCDPWIERFLALERSGWKGRNGSALACYPSTEGLFRDAIKRAHAKGAARLASLVVGGKTIAMTSWFLTGSHGHGFKMAYDEHFRSYGPGRLLMGHVAGWVDREPQLMFDTCAPRGSEPGPIWPHGRAIFDCAVAIGSPPRRAVFGAAMSGGNVLRMLCRRLRRSA